MDQSKKILEVNQAYKIYRGRPVIRNATFKLHAGECVLITGNNGSGKTTLLRLLTGTTLPTTGTVRLKKKLAVQYVPPKYILDTGMSAFQYLVLLTMVDGFSNAEAKKLCKELFVHYQLSGMEQIAVNRLSDGILRTMMLAQTLLRPCGLLALDAPFTGIDHDKQKIFYADMVKMKQQNTAILFTSLPSEREADEWQTAFVDKIWHIEHGEIKGDKY